MISVDEMSFLARKLADAKLNILDIEEQLKKAKEQERLLREETIPNAMQEIGVESIKLVSGEVITVRQNVYAQIPNEYKDQAMSWLNNNGFGGLIKIEVTTNFGKGESNLAKTLFDELLSRGEFNVSFSEGVHPQTLKAFLKEQINSGKNVPLDLFGARPVFEAVIKK